MVHCTWCIVQSALYRVYSVLRTFLCKEVLRKGCDPSCGASGGLLKRNGGGALWVSNVVKYIDAPLLSLSSFETVAGFYKLFTLTLTLNNYKVHLNFCLSLL